MNRLTPLRYVLASSSPRRKQLLRLIGINPDVHEPSVDENMLPDEPLTCFLERITGAKARNIYDNRMFDSVVVSADTVVFLQQDVIGKPADRADAKRMLSALSGQTHEVWTGVGILHRGEFQHECARTAVQFDVLSDGEIDHYLDHEHYMDKAGAYAIQGRAAGFVKKIEGCYFNVMGFPLNLFIGMLKGMGIETY